MSTYPPTWASSSSPVSQRFFGGAPCQCGSHEGILLYRQPVTLGLASRVLQRCGHDHLHLTEQRPASILPFSHNSESIGLDGSRWGEAGAVSWLHSRFHVSSSCRLTILIATSPVPHFKEVTA